VKKSKGVHILSKKKDSPGNLKFYQDSGMNLSQPPRGRRVTKVVALKGRREVKRIP